MVKAEQNIRCDVLVVGGAAAGLVAAIEARSQGAEILVVCKGKAGRSGNTIIAGCQFAAVAPYPGSEDSPEQHFQDALAGGQGINDETLLRILTSRGGAQLMKLEEWGVRFVRSQGEMVRRMPPGHSRPRGIPADSTAYPATVGGLCIALPLRKAAEQKGVRFLDDMPVVRLFAGQGQSWGALAIDLKRGQLVWITARAVVVAAGGAGRLYANTNNTRDICGDSYALMLQAGATLRDMEFVQFYPCQMTSPFRSALNTGAFGDGAVLRNRHGESFMHIYDPVNGEMATRDVMSRSIFYEVEKGNDIEGKVYIDWARVSEEALRTKYSSFIRELRKHGMDPSRDWIKVGNTTHFFMGGVQVDGSCDTGVPGLFAAGEAVGGVHGANRLSGNALTEAVVFGAVAGRAAAAHALSLPGLLEHPVPHPALETSDTGGDSLDEVRGALRQAMWRGASIVRSENSLKAALETIHECSVALDNCPAPSLLQAARKEETRLMCLTAEAVVLSALARKESRGAQFREDFPATEDRWLGSHLVRMVGDSLQVEFLAKKEN